MKKIVLISIVLVLISFGAFAQSIDLDDFPTGKWADEKYDCLWEFGANTIKILDMNGSVLYDFEDKTIKNFDIKASLEGIILSFSCVESERDYIFLKPPTNLDLEMTIDTAWDEHYKTDLPFRS